MWFHSKHRLDGGCGCNRVDTVCHATHTRRGAFGTDACVDLYMCVSEQVTGVGRCGFGCRRSLSLLLSVFIGGAGVSVEDSIKLGGEYCWWWVR